ncbi:MAG: GAF domain-containing protein, partial [Fusobacterium sp.]|nr:GAF domain-containing protein [Fusobacterium sp.]
MAIKRDSLLLRIIFHNGIALILISTIFAAIFGLIVFSEINIRLLDSSREKISFLSKAYINSIERTRDDLYSSTSNGLNLVIKDIDKIEVQNNLADVIVSQMKATSYLKYGNIYVQIISSKGFVIGDSGNKKIKSDIINKGRLVPNLKTLRKDNEYFYTGTKDELYVRIIQPYRWGNSLKRNYVLLTIPISNYGIQEIKEYAELGKDSKIFILSEGNYVYGELNNLLKEKQKLSFSNVRNKRVKKISKSNYYFFEKKFKGEAFYIGTVPLKDENGLYSGYIGVAISKEGYLAVKYMLATTILAVCLLAVVISAAFCTKIFAKLLMPLSNLADVTKKIGLEKDENSELIETDEESVYEIRTISNSLKAMLDRINSNEKELKNNNIKLRENLERIITIEKLLMAIDLDKSFTDSIQRLLKTLVSDKGFGYSRAIYLEYDENKETVSAKKLTINKSIFSNLDKYTQGIGGFKFQIKDLNNMLPLLKSKFERGNLFWDSLKTRKIIFHNDKGYKYDFGNDIFKSIGLNNFLILPIVDGGKKVACILVDNFGNNREISKEEVELMKLLLINLNIRVRNNFSEEEKIANERIATAI